MVPPDTIARDPIQTTNSRVVWLMIAGMLGALIVSYYLANLTIDLGTCGAIALLVPMLVAVSWYYRRWRSDIWISTGTEIAAQLVLILLLGTLLSYAAAAPAFPYRDATLYRIDRLMGFDWRAYLAFFNAHPLLGRIGNFAYFSMKLQTPVIIVALLLAHRIERLQSFVIATTIALVITLVIFMLTPAIAYYAYLHVPPSDFANLTPSTPYNHIRHLEGVRRGVTHVIRLNDLEGMITFPSFHTASAVLYVWALWPVRLMRWPMVVLNVLMVASTPIDGAHYAIDLIGGGGVAVVAIASAHAFRRAVISGRLSLLRERNRYASASPVPVTLSK